LAAILEAMASFALFQLARFAGFAHAVQLVGMEVEVGRRRPNIVMVLADDLHYEEDFIEHMPHLQQIARDGLVFSNHVSQSPLCGPSRASLLVGRFPHNSGYKTNAEKTSIDAFMKFADNSVGKWLTDAGYYTAFLGKYVNGMYDKVELTPSGWNHFGGFTGPWDFYKNQHVGGAYTYYNTSQWVLNYDETGTKLNLGNSDYPIIIHEGVHQADFLGRQTVEHAHKGMSMGKPFFIFTNPVMVHHGFCEGPFPDSSSYAQDDPWREEFEIRVPISPCPKKGRPELGKWRMHAHGTAWNMTARGQAIGGNCCDAADVERMSYGAANRTISAFDLDHMLGLIIDGLTKLDVLDNTFVIFTSDNGFHLGEHKLKYGKTMPYDHDLRVPLVIRPPRTHTPGLRVLPTSHVDLTRTIVDIAGAGKHAPLHALDGKSFIHAFDRDVAPSEWRRWSYSEMFESAGGKTWRNIRYIGDNGKAAWSLALWCKGKLEIYHMGGGDEAQLTNTIAAEDGTLTKKFGDGIAKAWMPVINGMGSCSGDACNHPHQVFREFDVRLEDLMVCSELLRRSVLSE
jgi:arylsulfatase A-like enzyme